MEKIFKLLELFKNRCVRFIESFSNSKERQDELELITLDAIALLEEAGDTVDGIESVVNHENFSPVTAHKMVQARLDSLNLEHIVSPGIGIAIEGIKAVKNSNNKRMLDEIKIHSSNLKLSELKKLVKVYLNRRFELESHKPFKRRRPGEKIKTVPVKAQVKRKLYKLNK